jgi:hypothetical protein
VLRQSKKIDEVLGKLNEAIAEEPKNDIKDKK